MHDHRKLDPAPPTIPVRLGIVGCGRLVERCYLPAARHAVGIRLVALADLDPGRCERAAADVRACRGRRPALGDGGRVVVLPG